MDNVTIGLALAAGILSFISPCVLPLVPAYIGYMGGRLTHDISRQGDSSAGGLAFRLRLLLHGIAFVLGFTAVFVLIGLLTTALSSLAGAYVSVFTEILGRVGGLVIIFFGFQFMGVMPRLFSWLRKKNQLRLLDNVLFSIGVALAASLALYWCVLENAVVALPLIAALLALMFVKGAFSEPQVFWQSRLDRLESLLYSDTRAEIGAQDRGGLFGSAFMGMVFSAGWTPCIGPLLGTILTVAATTGASTGDIAQGMLLLAAYSIGLGIPFVITALLLNSAQGLLRRLGRHMRKIELFSGSLLVLIGILVASGQLQSLSRAFSRGEFADFTFRVEECGVGFLNGEMRFSHLGACLRGQLAPVALNQSAGGLFSADSPVQEFLFQADAGRRIDVELRGINAPPPDMELRLFGPGDFMIMQASTGEALERDGKIYPIIGQKIDEAGFHRVELRGPAAAASGRYRIKIRDAEPLETASSQPPAESAFSAINSLTDIAADLSPATGLELGQRAPNFTLRTLEGMNLALADMADRVVLLNFWGTWCGPCRREMPEFEKVYGEWRDRGFEILAIAFNDSEAAMAAFRAEYGLSFPLALDGSGAVNEAYNIQTRPSSYLLAADNIVLARHFGVMSESQLEMLLTEALTAG